MEQKEERTMSLAQTKNEERVVISALNLSQNGILRLSSMGLFPGARIRVVDNTRPDTTIIECRGTRLALGRGLSHFIEVK